MKNSDYDHLHLGKRKQISKFFFMQSLYRVHGNKEKF